MIKTNTILFILRPNGKNFLFQKLLLSAWRWKEIFISISWSKKSGNKLSKNKRPGCTTEFSVMPAGEPAAKSDIPSAYHLPVANELNVIRNIDRKVLTFVSPENLSLRILDVLSPGHSIITLWLIFFLNKERLIYLLQDSNLIKPPASLPSEFNISHH